MDFVRIFSEDVDIDTEALLDRIAESSIDVVSELCNETDLSKPTKDILFEDLVLSQAIKLSDDEE